MILCKGCKYYTRIFGGLCKVHDGEYEECTNPYDGRTTRYYGMRPWIEKMRMEGGECGPDALLRKPGFWEQLKGMLQ